MYDKTTRKNGGNSFADAMFRFGASSENYARTMVGRKLDKEWGDDSPYTFHASEGFFIIAHEGVPVIIRDYQFVEKKRSESVHAFEEWVMEIIRREQKII